MSSQLFVIDKSPAIRHLIELTGKAQGFNVTAFPDGPSALQEAERIKPDFIIMNYQLEGLTVKTFCDKLNELDLLPNTFVALMVNDSDRYDEPTLISRGIKAFLPAPIRSEHIVKTMNDFRQTSPTPVVVRSSKSWPPENLDMDSNTRAPSAIPASELFSESPTQIEPESQEPNTPLPVMTTEPTDLPLETLSSPQTPGPTGNLTEPLEEVKWSDDRSSIPDCTPRERTTPGFEPEELQPLQPEAQLVPDSGLFLSLPPSTPEELPNPQPQLELTAMPVYDQTTDGEEEPIIQGSSTEETSLPLSYPKHRLVPEPLEISDPSSPAPSPLTLFKESTGLPAQLEEAMRNFLSNLIKAVSEQTKEQTTHLFSEAVANPRRSLPKSTNQPDGKEWPVQLELLPSETPQGAATEETIHRFLRGQEGQIFTEKIVQDLVGPMVQQQLQELVPQHLEAINALVKDAVQETVARHARDAAEQVVREVAKEQVDQLVSTLVPDMAETHITKEIERLTAAD